MIGNVRRTFPVRPLPTVASHGHPQPLPPVQLRRWRWRYPVGTVAILRVECPHRFAFQPPLELRDRHESALADSEDPQFGVASA